MAISYISNALGGTTTTTTFSITLPTTQTGDLIILEFVHRGTGNGTIGGTYTGPAFQLKHSQLFATSLYSGKSYWSIATGDHAGQTVTGSSLTDSCAAIVTVYRGTDDTDPLGDATIVGEQNASANETQAQITTATNGAWVVLVVVNSPDYAISSQSCTSPGALLEKAERLSTGGTDTSVAHASAVKASAGATGAFTWAQTNSASGSWAYAILPMAEGEQHSGTAIITGNGSLTGVIQKGGKGSALVSVTGALVAIGVAGMLAIASISGSGSQVATGKKTALSDAVISGNGSLVATGEAFQGEQHQGIGVISGGGEVISEGTKNGLNSISISANGTVTSSGIKSTSETIQISGTGLLEGIGSKQTSGNSSISGSGSIVAEGYQPVFHSGIGVISGNGLITGEGEKNAEGTLSIHIEVPSIIMGSDGKLSKKISDTFYIKL